MSFFAVQKAMLGNPDLLMLMRSSAARAVRSCRRTATTGVRVQLQSSVGLALLSVAADPAAAADSARVLVTAWIQDMRKRCIHHILYLVDCFEYLSAIHHLFIRSSYPAQE